MRLLLDTHVLVWLLTAPERLRPEAREAIAASGTTLWLSPISTWEVAMLAERGRLRLQPNAAAWIERALAVVPAQEAPLVHAVALASRRVVLPHQDPADRFLAATALVYDLTLATADERLLAAEGVPTLSC